MSLKVVIIFVLVTLEMYILEKGTFVPLDEKKLRKLIPKFQSLTVQAKQRELDRWLKEEADEVCIVEPELYLPNIHKMKPKADLQLGARVCLSVTKLFEVPATGFKLLANILCGLRCTALRETEPAFYPALSINSGSPEIKELLISVVQAVVPRRRWKQEHCTIKRKAVLDYGEKSIPGISAQIRDFSHITAKCRDQKIKAPFPYKDTVVLVSGANNVQIREATPYIEHAATILLNSATGDLLPEKLPSSSVSAYDPEIAIQFETAAQHVAALLRWWWELCDDDAWARQIVQAARASFGKPDSRYIRVELDPKKLRNAILYQVLLSFLDEVEAAGFMTAEELAPYRQGTKEVFDPIPPEPVRQRRAEDPDVFLEIMKAIAESPSAPIIAEGERFVKKDKPLAAWRTISGELHLVFLEKTWAQAYTKAAKATPGIDCSFLQVDSWESRMQKVLCDKALIKSPSSGHRYRYDLIGDGTRDSTYVVAIPAKVLEN